MKKIVAIAALLALVLTLAVPAGAENAGVEKAEFGLGYLNSTAHLLGFIAKEEGYFEEEDSSVPYRSSPSRARARI